MQADVSRFLSVVSCRLKAFDNLKQSTVALNMLLLLPRSAAKFDLMLHLRAAYALPLQCSCTCACARARIPRLT